MTADELREIVEASGVSKSQYARQIDVAYRHLNRMLGGERPVTADTADRVRSLAAAPPVQRTIMPDRILARARRLGIRSQSDLARLIGASQQTLNGLLTRPQERSRYLPKLAEVLHTSQAWLRGETDDPDEGAPGGRLLAPQLVSLQVSIPAEAALVDAVEEVLAETDGQPREQVARAIAQRIPVMLRARPTPRTIG